MESELGLTFSSDLPQVLSLVVENFDAVCSVVRDENLLTVVDHHPVGKLEVFGATELV